jgi:hypothetical protein
MGGVKLKKSEKRKKGFLYYLKGAVIPAGAYRVKAARGGKKKKKKKVKKKKVKKRKVKRKKPKKKKTKIKKKRRR